jgi:hypothetical protein
MTPTEVAAKIARQNIVADNDSKVSPVSEALPDVPASSIRVAGAAPNLCHRRYHRDRIGQHARGTPPSEAIN